MLLFIMVYIALCTYREEFIKLAEDFAKIVC